MCTEALVGRPGQTKRGRESSKVGLGLIIRPRPCRTGDVGWVGWEKKNVEGREVGEFFCKCVGTGGARS